LNIGVLLELNSSQPYVAALDSNFFDSVELKSGSIKYANHKGILERTVTFVPINHENWHWILFVIFNTDDDDAHIFGIDNLSVVQPFEMENYANILLKYAYYYLFIFKICFFFLTLLSGLYLM